MEKATQLHLESFLIGMRDLSLGVTGIIDIPQKRMERLRKVYENEKVFNNLASLFEEEGISIRGIGFESDGDFFTLRTDLLMKPAAHIARKNGLILDFRKYSIESEVGTMLECDSDSVDQLSGLFDKYSFFIQHPAYYSEICRSLLEEYFTPFVEVEKCYAGISDEDDVSDEELDGLQRILDMEEAKLFALIREQGLDIRNAYSDGKFIYVDCDMFHHDARKINRDMGLNLGLTQYSDTDRTGTHITAPIEGHARLVNLLAAYAEIINPPFGG